MIKYRIGWPSETNGFESDAGPSAYELARSSGTLAFWDATEEDLYTFDDGEPVGDEN